MSIMAVAAVAMTMTSCNKDEAFTGNNFNVTFEESEVMNQQKTHFVGNAQVWDEGDLFYIMDGSNNIAYYHIDLNANPNYIFNRAVRGNFDENNGTLTAFYPTNIVYNNNPNEVKLPIVHTNTNGNIPWPMYAQGTLETFRFRNLCALVTFNLKGDVVLDSISITTENYLNGHFKVNIANLDSPLKYGTGSGSSRYTAMGHGLRTNTLKFQTPLQLTNEAQEVNFSIPSGTYKNFTITFYSNGKRFVKTNRNDITINRTTFNTSNTTLSYADFEDFVPGALNAQYNVGTATEPSYVVFSQGNLEYVSLPNQIWRFADNQYDFRGTAQKAIQNQYDRDLFAWGANGYYRGGSLVGNGIKVWGANNDFGYSNANVLSGNDEWGNNKIANGGNQANSGWRTLSTAELNNLMTNYQHAIVTLGFAGKTGLVIFADGATTYTDGATLNKEQWNALQNAGCIFFEAANYRNATGSIDSRIPAGRTTSYYWLNDGAALVVDANAATIESAPNKKIGGFVRLVKDAE